MGWDSSKHRENEVKRIQERRKNEKTPVSLDGARAHFLVAWHMEYTNISAPTELLTIPTSRWCA